MWHVCPGSNSEMCKPEEEEFHQSLHRFFPFPFIDLQYKYLQAGMIDNACCKFRRVSASRQHWWPRIYPSRSPSLLWLTVSLSEDGSLNSFRKVNGLGCVISSVNDGYKNLVLNMPRGLILLNIEELYLVLALLAPTLAALWMFCAAAWVVVSDTDSSALSAPE